MASQRDLSLKFVQDSSSESESEASEQASKVSKATTKSHKTAINGRKESSSSASTSSSEEASGSDSDSSTQSMSSNGSKRKESTGKSAEPAQKRSKSSKSQPTRVPSIQYQPPPGYEALKPSQVDQISMFDIDTLPSQQIWHITAPASVPITSIKSLDMQAALRGEPALEHNGTKYNFHAMPVKGETLLLPSKSDASYKSMNVPVSRNLHLREMTLPQQSSKPTTGNTKASTAPQTAGPDAEHAIRFTASKIGEKRAPRPEVKGLMMRYHPYGSAVIGKEKIGNPTREEDELEEMGQVNSFRPPPDMPMDFDTSTSTRTPEKDKRSKKKEKPNTPISSQIEATNGDAMDIDSPVAKTAKDASSERTKKKKKQRSKN